MKKKGRYSKFDCIFTFTTNVINLVLSFITSFHIQLLINRSFNNISNAVYFETQNHHFLLFSLGNSLIVINIHTFVMPYYWQLLIEFVLLFVSLASLKKKQ